MHWKHHTPEEIAAKLERAQALLDKGESVANAAKLIGVTEATFFRWRRTFGRYDMEQIRKIKELEAENARLRKALFELEPDYAVPRAAARAN